MDTSSLFYLCFILCLAETCSGTVVDLTHIYGPDVLYPPVGPNGSADMFNFTIIHRGYAPDLDAWLEINWYGVFEHGGTHIDAPAHYIQGRAHLHEIPVDQLYGPGVMIDITEKAKQNPDYLLTVKDITDWEGKHGQIPQDSIVMMNAGKHKLYPNRKLFYGTETPEDMSTYHNPGVHPETAKWLVQNRQIKVFGTDSHSCDPGQNGSRNPCHVAFLSNGVLLLEFVANLDRMPPIGSNIFIGPMKMRDGSGGPCRILAIYGDGGEAASSADRMVFTVVPSVALLLVAFVCVRINFGYS